MKKSEWLNSKNIGTSLLGYNMNQMDEYVGAILEYCQELDYENRLLKKDLMLLREVKELSTDNNEAHMVNENEYSILIGKVLPIDLVDSNHIVAAKKDTLITSYVIETLMWKGMYGELVAAVK